MHKKEQSHLFSQKVTQLAQAKLIDQLIVIIVVLSVFLCVFSLLRVLESGWQKSYYIDIAACVLLFLLIFCRRLFTVLLM